MGSMRATLQSSKILLRQVQAAQIMLARQLKLPPRTRGTSQTMLAAPNLSPAIIGTFINDNVLTDVYGGIRVNGMWGFPTLVSGNNITMQDGLTGLVQHGIGVSNCFSNANGYGKHVITGNTVSSAGSNSLTNSQVSLIYCGNSMGAGLQSPSVTCNDVNNGFNGFEFEGSNQGTQWLGNQMQDLARGMLLNNSGVIGTQGGLTLGIGEGWNGTWNPGINYGLYTYNSWAYLSPLYVGSSGSDSPPNLFGSPAILSYVNYPPIAITPSYAGFNCAYPTSIVTNPVLPDASDYDDDDAFYIAQTAMYRYLYMNDSIRASDLDYDGFNIGLSGSSIDNFMQADLALSVGDLATAAYYNGLVTATSTASKKAIIKIIMPSITSMQLIILNPPMIQQMKQI